ncbi:MAG TPA: 3-hydroxyacyl-CoA dehydrogenase family protein [Bryobacteraceae bacterium]|nr:3-hydroxyacyl-CoA dehydrogenase family protein [Bryobacteraceae bacterium]
MSNTSFRTAAVIGTGMMGPGIAGALALGGLHTTILSRSEETAAKGLASARAQLRILADNALAEMIDVREAFERLSASAAFDRTIGNADLVIESAPENMDLKQKLFARMDSLAGKSAVLASNTSGLSITAIASRCRRPERVLTTHFWNPPHLMPLVEIVQGEKTSPQVAQSVRELLAACGKVPVLVKRDRPGQLGNRLQMALVREAAYIVEEGIADVEDVDLVAKNGFGLRMPAYGIFEHQDAVGLDMGISILDYVAQDLYNLPKAPNFYRAKVAHGDLGAKTGKGFYDWSKKSIEEVKAGRDQFVIDVLRARRKKREATAT